MIVPTGRFRLLGSLLVGLVPVASGYVALGGPILATRGWVEEFVLPLRASQAAEHRALQEIQIENLQNRLEAIEADIFNQEKRYQAKPDEDVKWRIDNQKRYQKNIQDRLDRLRSDKN
jgi:hypothetical protein